MALPKEAIISAFPPRRNAVRTTIHSPALIHLFALGACGNALVCGKDAPTMQQQVELLAVLSLSPDQLARVFENGAEPGAARIAHMRDRMTLKTCSEDLLAGITLALDALNESLACFVPTRDPESGDEMESTRIDNWGWPLVAVEFIMHEYPAYDFEAALRMPLARAFSCRALAEVLRGRRVPCTPSYGEKAYIDAMDVTAGRNVGGDA